MSQTFDCYATWFDEGNGFRNYRVAGIKEPVIRDTLKVHYEWGRGDVLFKVVKVEKVGEDYYLEIEPINGEGAEPAEG